MSPSLKEKFNQIYPPDKCDGHVGLEGMFSVKLTLKEKIGRLSNRFGGRIVEIVGVDLEADRHHCQVLEGNSPVLEVPNDADIYE